MSKLNLKTMFNHPAFVPGCIFLGLLLRLVVDICLPLEQRSDSAWYSHRAQELANGGQYQESGIPTAYWPIGWPFILSLVIRVSGSLDLSILVINLLGYLLIMAMIYVFGIKVIQDHLATRLALFLYAIYPNHITYTGVAATELAYTSLLMAAFGLLIVKRHSTGYIFLAGMIFGVSTLIKPQTMLFPLGAMIALTWVYSEYSFKRGFTALMTLYLAMILTVSPWTYRNYRVFDAFIPVSTNGGVGLLQGASDFTTGEHVELRHTGIYDEMDISWEDRASHQVEMDKKQKQAAMEWIKENPMKWLGWMPKKVLLLWSKDTDGFWTLKANHPQYERALTLGQWVNQLFYMFILMLSLPAIIFAIRGLLVPYGAYAPLGLLFCAPVFVTILAAFFTGQIRYHFPAMPFLILAAAWGGINFRLWFRTQLKPVKSPDI